MTRIFECSTYQYNQKCIFIEREREREREGEESPRDKGLFGYAYLLATLSITIPHPILHHRNAVHHPLRARPLATVSQKSGEKGKR